MENKKLEAEYDRIFDGDEKVMHMLKLEKGSFTAEYKNIDIMSIGFPDFCKKGRKTTRIGLTTSVKELGVMQPVVVMTTESAENLPEDLPDDVPIIKYMIVDGTRRVYAARKNNEETIDALVLDFTDKEKGRQVALPLGLCLSKKQKRTYEEIWYLLNTLELQSNYAVTPNTLEWLLDLEPGDSMKLKDIMLSKDDEVMENLLSGKKDIQQAYNLLQKHRKEEDKLEKEDNTGISEVEGADGVINTKEKPQLTDEEVTSLLNIDDDVEVDDMSLEELDKTNEVRGVEHQKSGDRHPIDPAIKQSVLHRDKFTCQCCGLHGQEWLGVLVYHHKVPVSAGGPDTVDNGITLCSNCHITLHIYVEGKLVKPEFKEMTEEQIKTLKNIMKYGNIAIKAYGIRKMSREEIIKADSSSRRHLMPGEGLAVNKEAFEQAKRDEK